MIISLNDDVDDNDNDVDNEDGNDDGDDEESIPKNILAQQYHGFLLEPIDPVCITPSTAPSTSPACLSANLLAQGRPSRLALLPPHHLLPLPASLPTDWFTLIIMGVAFMVKNISMVLKPKTTINAPWR